MTSPLDQLDRLEKKFNGPIPRAELDAALDDTHPAIRFAQANVRFYESRSVKAINASAIWRKSQHGLSLPPHHHLQLLARRVALAHTMVLSISQLLAWRETLLTAKLQTENPSTA